MHLLMSEWADSPETQILSGNLFGGATHSLPDTG